ncbi:hypothetical protein Adt_32930 [Abeliophyllum distichum]|uniref:Uncharacterized protein n=1 Tax=Abeliophyllum distichum TaxID=126358 RepID=A0ABD1QYE8_9LAMI
MGPQDHPRLMLKKLAESGSFIGPSVLQKKRVIKFWKMKSCVSPFNTDDVLSYANWLVVLYDPLIRAQIARAIHGKASDAWDSKKKLRKLIEASGCGCRTMLSTTSHCTMSLELRPSESTSALKRRTRRVEGYDGSQLGHNYKDSWDADKGPGRA